ncbi:MAG: hypothetical protein ABH851_04515 [Methanobacteriota archaeon]
MPKVKRFGAVSVGKTLGAVYAVFGLIPGVIFTVFALLGGILSGSKWALVPAGIGIGAIVFIPIIYGILGFILGWLIAVVYNIISKRVGGIEVEID